MSFLQHCRIILKLFESQGHILVNDVINRDKNFY